MSSRLTKLNETTTGALLTRTYRESGAKNLQIPGDRTIVKGLFALARQPAHDQETLWRAWGKDSPIALYGAHDEGADILGISPALILSAKLRGPSGMNT